MQSTAARPETYSYRLEFWAGKGRRVHEVALASADFSRAEEAAFFDGLRRGVFRDYDPPLGRCRLEPRFTRGESGSPHTAGFTVVVPKPEGGEHRVEFGSRFFHNQVSRISADLVRNQRVDNGTVLLYQLAAYLDREEVAANGSGILLEPASAEVPIRPGSLAAFGATEAWDNPQPEDFQVLIPRRVLEESVEEAGRAPEREVGGILLGHLRRDEQTGKVFLEVTCQVPAEETQATDMSITFTPATWARVREVIDLRGEGEIFAGWVHSHPFRFCAECPLPTPPDCIQKVLFYSSDDEFLMELSFARPFMIGLLTAVEPRLEKALGHLPVRLYGWRNGEIAARGFEVIDER